MNSFTDGLGVGLGFFLWLEGGNAVRFSDSIFSGECPFFDRALLLLTPVFDRVVGDELFVCDKFLGANFWHFFILMGPFARTLFSQTLLA